jgi:hypothetical protein
MKQPPIISPDARRIRELEDRLFAHGEMLNAPCFVCGYNNTGYFNPALHPCAARHHALYQYEQDKE